MASNLVVFKVSAPGKVILHGEHSVVYGKPALAGAVDARNFLYFTEHSDDTLYFDYVSVNLQHKLNVANVNEALKEFRGSKENLENLDKVERIFGPLIPTDVSDQGKKGVLSTLYLLCGILSENNLDLISTGFQIRIKSELSVGAGLGSSASFGVCLAAAFLIYARQKTAIGSSPTSPNLSVEDKQLISSWAFKSEKIMHGTPSGVDNTVCTFGGIVKFTKQKPIVSVEAKRKISILLVDSRVSRSTIKLVKRTAELKEEFPTIVDHILSAMEEVANEAARIYALDTAASKDIFGKLEKLFQINNDLLKAIGASHPRLEDIFRHAQANGFSSKITGAGGGGYALVLLPDDYENMESFKTLCESLINDGFTFIETAVGGPGVIVDCE